MNFGENLKNIRKSKKMSQEQLAEKVRVSRQSVSKWETGDAYPEMNNILQLCKIFNCKINDLVHTNMKDFDSLDEEIIMNVVKFNEKEQRNMKGVSKIISIISKIIKVFAILGTIISVICMLALPFVIKNISVIDNNIVLNNNKIATLESSIETSQVIDVLNNYSTTKITLLSEIILFSLVITFVITYMLFNYLDKVFKNIHDGQTAFTIDNINYIKRIIICLILNIVVPFIIGLLTELAFNMDLGIELELSQILFVIIVIAIFYIFQYGYQIQKDSKGVMYNE